MGLSDAIGELFVLLRVKDETSVGLKSAEGNIGKTGKAAQDAGKEAEVMGKKFGRAVTAIAAAAAGAIAAIELVTSRAKQLNAGFDSIAASTGNERDALRGLASDLQNVTFSYDEILDTFQAIEAHGVRNIATYKAVADAADTLGSATRSSAAESADVILQIADAFDISADQAIASIDSIAVANRQYGADLSEISKLVGTYGDEYDELGLSFDDLIASYAALRAEGRTHKDAMKEIGEATKDAADAEGIWADAMDDAASSQASLTAQIESGQEALAGIADRIAASTRAIADYDKEIAKQEQTVAELADAITDAEASVDIFADAYAQVTAEAERFTDAIETEQETLDGLNDSLAKAQQAHADLLDQYAATEQEIGRLTVAYEQAKNANDYFAAAYKDATDALDDANAAYAANVESIGDLQDAYADLTDDQQKATATLADLQAEYRDASTSTEWLDEATRDHAAEVERLEDRYDRLTRSVANYQDRIEDSRHETGNLERDLAREKETLAELQAEWDSLTGAKNAMGGALYVDPASMADLAGQIRDSQDKIGEYTWKIAENREEQVKFAKDAADAAQEIAGAKAELDAAKNSQEWYTEAVREHEESLARMSERVATAAERVADIGDRLAKNRGAFADASDDSGTLAKALADARADVDEFGTAVYGTPEKLSPFQEALRRTQERAQDLQTDLINARTRLGDLRTEIGENETTQGRYQQKIADSIGTLQEYDRKLAGTMLEIQKFRDAGLDYVKQSAPFEDAQKRQADAVERARDAYGDAVDRLADLKQSRADEVTNLATYRSEYAETERAVAGYRKELERVNEQIAILNANPPNPVQALRDGLPDTSGVDLNKPGYANQTGGIEDQADSGLVDQGKSWLERTVYDVGTALEPYAGAIETGIAVGSTLYGLKKLGDFSKELKALAPVADDIAKAGAEVGTEAVAAETVAKAGTGILGRISTLLGKFGGATMIDPQDVSGIDLAYTEATGKEIPKQGGGLIGDLYRQFSGDTGATGTFDWIPGLLGLRDKGANIEVDTQVNPPSGDFDWIHFLSGGMIATGSAAEMVPIDKTFGLNSTVTGGAETTAAIDAEVLRGVQAAEATGSTVAENATIAALLANPDWYIALEEQAGPGIQALASWMQQQVTAAMSPPINPYGTIDDGSYLGDPRHHESVNPGTAGVEWMPGYGPEGYIGGYQSPETAPNAKDAYGIDRNGEPFFTGDPNNPADVAAYQKAWSDWAAAKTGLAGAASPAASPPTSPGGTTPGYVPYYEQPGYKEDQAARAALDAEIRNVRDALRSPNASLGRSPGESLALSKRLQELLAMWGQRFGGDWQTWADMSALVSGGNLASPGGSAPLPARQSTVEGTLQQVLAAFGAGGSVGGSQPIAIQLTSDIPFVAKQITALNADSRYRAGIRTHT